MPKTLEYKLLLGCFPAAGPCADAGRLADTEIDWQAYMEQVAQYLAGERDYARIKGGTGPLVYPGAHVYIYRGLYALTHQGRDIRLAQIAFAGLYVAALVVTMACYRLAKVPPYVFPMMVLSKRLHSIFMLRCFNDGFAVFFFFLAIYAYQKRMWTLGSVFYSLAVGVKMSALLALPAVGIILLQAIGKDRAITQAGIIGYLQVRLMHIIIDSSPWTNNNSQLAVAPRLPLHPGQCQKLLLARL